MGRIVVNKHYDNSLNVTSDKFVNRGEIIVCNEPGFEGLYILSIDGKVIKVGQSNSEGGEVSQEFKDYLKSYYLTSGETANLINALDTRVTSVEEGVRPIVTEEIAKVVASADTSYDTLKEIADWILNDTTGAASMANDISDLKEQLASIKRTADDSHIYLTEEEKDILFASGSVMTSQYGLINIDSAVCYFVYESTVESGNSGTTVVEPSATVDEASNEIIIGDTTVEDGSLDLTKYAIINSDGVLEFITVKTSAEDNISIDIDTESSSIVMATSDSDYYEETSGTLSLLSNRISVDGENNTLIIN